MEDLIKIYKECEEYKLIQDIELYKKLKNILNIIIKIF